jgi:CHAD domain-containing protein
VLSNYRALLKTAGQPEHVSALRVCDVARPTVAPLLRRVLQRGRAIDADAKPSRLHKLRIDAKRLRYQLEALAPAYGDTLAPVQRALKKLQDLLGEYQDAEVARTHLADYRHSRAVGKMERKTFKHLVAHEKARARRLHKRFPKRWTAFEQAAEGLIDTL